MANHYLSFLFLALFIGVSFVHANGRSHIVGNSSSSGGVKYYTVSSEFAKFIRDAKTGGASAHPRITNHSDGSYSISITTSKGTRELKNIDKRSVDLFTSLYINPNELISVNTKGSSDVTISISENSATSTTYTSSKFSSGGGAKQFTVSSEFYSFLTEARAGGENVTPKITNSGGTYSISITTSKGTRELKNISKDLVDLFAQLFTTPNLKISLVSKSGSNVVISVVEESEGSAYTYSPSFSSGGGAKEFTVTSEFYSFLIDARDGGVNVRPTITSNSDGTYTISITTSKGTRELKNVPKNIVDLFAQLFSNPNLKISVVSKSGSNVKISVVEDSSTSYTYTSRTSVVGSGTVSRDGSQEVRSYTVTIEFYDFITEARNKVVYGEPIITTNSDGTYTITITTSKGKRVLKNIRKNLVDFFIQLYTNPSLKITFDSKSGPNAKISVSEDSDGSSPVQLNVETIQLIKDLQTNPDLKLTHVSKKNGVYTLTFLDKGKPRTITGIPSKVAQLIIYKARHPNSKINLSRSGKASIPVTSTTIRTSYTIGPKFLEAYNFLKKNPTSQIKVKQEPDNSYTLTITFDGKPKTYRNVDLSLAQLIIFLFKNPKLDFKVTPQSDGKYTIVLPKNADNTPTTSAIPIDFLPKLEKILKDPKITVKIEEPKPGEFQLVVEDDTGKKTYKVPKSLIPVVVQLLKTPKRKDGKPRYHVLSKNGKNPHISLNTEPETTTRPVDDTFVTFIKKLEKNPDLAKKITYNIQPTADKKYDVTVTLDTKKYVFKNLPNNFVQFFINFVNEPKNTPHTITKHDTPGKHSTKDVPHTPKHTLTVNKPVGNEIPLKVKPATKHEPSTTKFPSTHKVAISPPKPNKAAISPPKSNKVAISPPKPTGRNLVLNTHEQRRVYRPKQHKPSTLDLLNTVKNSPHLKISVKPSKPGFYDIVVDDGVHKTTYPDIPVTTLIGLIKVRSNKNLPFEILPSQKPGHVNIKVPDENSPDTNRFSVSPDVLEVTDAIRNDPKTQLEITPDKNGHFTLTTKRNGKEHKLKDLPSDAVETLIRLKSDDSLPFNIKPGKNGKLDLIVPKQHPRPVKTKLAPNILELIGRVKKNPYLTFNLLPGKKPRSFTIELKDGAKTQTYPDISFELIPILSQLYLTPSVDFEIKPTKDGSIQFLPSHSKPGDHHYEIPNRVFDIISSIKSKPWTTLKIHPTKQDYSITLTEHGQPKTYQKIKPDDVRLIIDFVANDNLPFSVKPNEYGVTLIVPKTDDTKRKVALLPGTKNTIKDVRSMKNPDFTIEPDKHGQFTISVGGKQFNQITPSLLELLVALVTKPDLTYKIEPEADGSMSAIVPKESPQTTQVKISSDKVQFINDLRRKPVNHIKLIRDKQGYFDIEFDTPEGKKTLKHIKPNAAQFLVDVVTNPRLPFYIYSEDDDYKLVIPKRPSEPKFTTLPKNVLSFLIKEVKNPRLSFDITPDHQNLGRFDVDFYLDAKKIQHFHYLDRYAIEFINVLFSHPDTKIETERDSDGVEVIVLRRFNLPTRDFTISGDSVKLITFITKNVISASARHGKPGTFDLTVGYTNGASRTIPGIPKLVFEPLFLILTKNVHTRIYIDSYGKFRIALPSAAVTSNNFKVSPDFYNFLVKIQPEISSLSFTLTATGKDYSLALATTSHKMAFNHFSSSAIEFFIQFLLHPQRKTEIQKVSQGTNYQVHVVKRVLKQGANIVVFTNVKAKFIQLINDLRRKQGNSITIHRKSDLTLLLGYGTKGLQFEHFQPAVVIELLVAIFADPNFRYAAKIAPDGTYVFAAVNLKRDYQFRSLSAAARATGLQLTAAAESLILITRDAKNNLILATSINGGRAVQLNNVDVETVTYLMLSTVYKNLQFQQQTSASGQIWFYIRLPASRLHYDLRLFRVQSRVILDISRLYGGIFLYMYAWLRTLVAGLIVTAASYVSGVVYAAANVVGRVVAANYVANVAYAAGNLFRGIFG